MRKTRKKLSFVIALIFLFSQCLSGVASAATSTASVSTKDLLKTWVGTKLEPGYSGKFKTSASITKAELASLLVKALNLPAGNYIKFSDVSSKAWYRTAVGKATLAGIMSSTGKFHPHYTMSKQIGAIIIYKAFGQTAPTMTNPKARLTRGEALKLINTLTGIRIKKSPSAASKTYYGNVVINNKNVVLKNATVKGNLVIAQGVGTGDVTLENVKVEKSLIVLGGGENSIKLVNSTLNFVDVNKKDGKVRLLASGVTNVGLVNMHSGGKLEELNMDALADGFTTMKVTGITKNAAVIIDADLEEVRVEVPNCIVKVLDCVIDTFTAEAACTVSGIGLIANANIAASGVVMEKAPIKIKALDGITCKVEGIEIDPLDVYAPTDVSGTLTFEGYIQDLDCFIKMAPNFGKDSKKCLAMKTCAASGYGITALQPDGTFKFYYLDGDFATWTHGETNFDGTGSQLASWNLINATQKANHVTIKVTGKLSGDTKVSPWIDARYDGRSYPVINVTSLEEVTTSPVLTSIAVTTPATKLIYTVGDALDITGLKTTGYYVDNTSAEATTMTAANVTGFDSSVPATNQILTITYGGKTATYKIDVVSEQLTGWIIDRDCLGKNVPTMHSRMCNLMGSANTPPTSCYASGLGIYTNISAPTVKTDRANYLVFDEGSRNLTKTFLQNLPSTWANNITVKVTGYKVNKIPTNETETNVPETDISKIHHYISGFHVTSIEAAFIEGISTNVLPSPNLVLPGSTVLSSIAVSTPATKLTFAVGDALSIEGLGVTGTYSDNTTKAMAITAANVTGFVSSVPANNQILTVTYGGKTATYTINVVAVPTPTPTPTQTVTFTGFIQDQDCFVQYAPDYGADTKMCLLMHSCAASGYGITALQGDGTYKFYYFDGNFATYLPWAVGTGSQLAAWNLCSNTKKSNHVTISVTGTLSGVTKVSPDNGLSYPVLNVTSITETN